MNDLSVIFNLATTNYDRGDFEAAAQFFIHATNLGSNVAMNNLAFMYQYGHGVDINYARAIELFKRAADLGNIVAMNNLGCTYSKGIGVEINKYLAIEYFKKAAGKGSIKSLYNLANMYKTEKKLTESVKIYKQLIDIKSESKMAECCLLTLYLEENIDFSNDFEWVVAKCFEFGGTRLIQLCEKDIQWQPRFHSFWPLKERDSVNVQIFTLLLISKHRKSGPAWLEYMVTGIAIKIAKFLAHAEKDVK